MEFPEVVSLIRELERAHVVGRRGYGPRKLIPVIIIRIFYVLPAWTTALETIADNPRLLQICGCANADELPSIHAIYRFLAKERSQRWVSALTVGVQAAIRAADPEYGRVAAADSTDVAAYANGQRYIRKGGPPRQRFSDPDASWGHRGSVSTRKGGGFFGYKVDGAVCVTRELPVGMITRPAAESELAQVDRWLEAVADSGFCLETLILDRGYDYGPVYESCHRRKIRMVCPLRERDKPRDANRVPVCRHNGRDHQWIYAGTDITRGATKWRCPVNLCRPKSTWVALDRFNPAIPRSTPRSRTFYDKRGAVERFWSRMKRHWGLLELRVRGLDRVSQHVSLLVLGPLLLELAKLRAAP